MPKSVFFDVPLIPDLSKQSTIENAQCCLVQDPFTHISYQYTYPNAQGILENVVFSPKYQTIFMDFSTSGFVVSTFDLG